MSENFNHYNPKLKEFARELRNESVSRAEKYLWKALLFIVDFFSAEINLIIEIDGNSHYSKPEYDQYRQEKLESFGYKFLRFSEGAVINQFDDVHEKIVYAVWVLKGNPEGPPP